MDAMDIVGIEGRAILRSTQGLLERYGNLAFAQKPHRFVKDTIEHELDADVGMGHLARVLRGYTRHGILLSHFGKSLV